MAKMSKYLDLIKYSFYIILHPNDGFYELRHRNKGSVVLALFYVILFSFSFSTNRIKASFIVNDTNPRNVDAFYELLAIGAFFLLLTVANWSITCLMEGEGRYKDIVTCIGYALLPLDLCLLPLTALSYLVAGGEEAFYYLVLGLGIAWSCILMLVGIMIIHNYSLGKTIITLILTFISMLLILFIILLLSNLVVGLLSFIKSIYMELSYRL